MPFPAAARVASAWTSRHARIICPSVSGMMAPGLGPALHPMRERGRIWSGASLGNSAEVWKSYRQALAALFACPYLAQTTHMQCSTQRPLQLFCIELQDLVSCLRHAWARA